MTEPTSPPATPACPAAAGAASAPVRPTAAGRARWAAGRGRRRDRQVYLRRYPLLFTLLAATRRRPVARLGRTVLVHDAQSYLDALTRIPLDRLAAGTVGGAARQLGVDGLLFDQEGPAHLRARRALADGLGPAGVARLRPVWTQVLRRRLAPLARGASVDLVPVVAELAGATTAALLGVCGDPSALAAAARRVAATAAAEQLPGPRRPGRAEAARRATSALADLLDPSSGGGGGAGSASGPGLAGMLAVAAVNTTVAGVPRAVAWCADDRLWRYAEQTDTREILVDELLRVTAPSPLLPRVAAGSGELDGCPVRPGDRLLLVARHAAGAHRGGPDCVDPAPTRTARLVFGAGRHSCPGARLARAQLADVLAALAPYRPVVVSARADGRAALPGWARLVIRAGRCG
ncbi:cytochrome P450 [Micromonospora sp. WMMD882]|uniref:cytochrome P450 n=1 Tax=Micromonospora sp. WMMD882 TaxID=3015151 RepID=UPI00248C9C0E|nr:cytochrome P450 [Micromonospora sp. WMMD882]WBB81017.1 cytochrome P450 [Micromonospora sp. WMMD882]